MSIELCAPGNLQSNHEYHTSITCPNILMPTFVIHPFFLLAPSPGNYRSAFRHDTIVFSRIGYVSDTRMFYIDILVWLLTLYVSTWRFMRTAACVNCHFSLWAVFPISLGCL